MTIILLRVVILDLKYINEKIQNRKVRPLGVKQNYSVLLPLIHEKSELHILFEVRASHLSTQPGEISFPGGSVEEGESYKEAAIRETQEELNIKKESIEILGELDYIVSPYNFELHVYCGYLNEIQKDEIFPNAQEVNHIFTVPIKYFLENEPKLYNIELETVIRDDFPYHLIQNGKDYNWRKGKYPCFFYLFQKYVIWGMTARFTKNFIDILKKEK